MLHTKDQSYIVLAKRYIGQREVPGIKSNSWIKQLWLDTGAGWLWSQYGYDDSRLPWCGGFAAWSLKMCSYKPPEKFWSALSWASWGDDAGGPCHGAVAVLKRDGGGHVTFVTGVTSDGTYFRGLGGNQGDKVSEAWFPVDRVVAWRLPSGNVRRPTNIATRGELSKSEA